MKGAKPQVQTTTVDPQTQAYVNQIRQQALGYAGMGGGTPGTPGFSMWGLHNLGGTPGTPGTQTTPVDPRIAQMSQNYSNAGNLGIGALTGGPNPFMNPFMSQMDPYFAQQRAQAVGGANDQATLAGAFGGDRSQIGAATAGNLADQNAAQFRFQAFNDAQQRALQAANLGYGAAFMPQQYAQGQINLLNSAIGPYGQTSMMPQQRNVGAGILGGALAGSQFGIPGIIGGGILGSGLLG
jgi:hypothetical protein